MSEITASEAAAIAAMSAEIARLRAALKPFADLGVGSGPDYEAETYRIVRSAIRTARAALKDAAS